MKSIGYILGIAGLIVGVWLFRKYQAAQRLSFSVGSPQGIRFTSTLIEWVQPIQVTNPEAIGIKIQGVSLDNYFGGAQVGRSVLFQPTTIAGQSTTILPVTVQVPYANLLQAIPDFWNVFKNKSIKFQLIGDLTAEGVKVPINQTINLAL